jgi:divalent metal cation (Fe/Co/Zn/Cd) transporter
LVQRGLKKENDELHPFGYGREVFFWGFMVAILLFFGGAIFQYMKVA